MTTPITASTARTFQPVRENQPAYSEDFVVKHKTPKPTRKPWRKPKMLDRWISIAQDGHRFFVVSIRESDYLRLCREARRGHGRK